MTNVMNMSSYLIEETPAMESAYREQAQRAEMSPFLELAIQHYEVISVNRHATLPLSLANENAEMFLRRMCANRY